MNYCGILRGMTDELPVGDKMYVSSKRAAEITGYAQDYIGQLARGGHIKAKRSGGLWYIDVEYLKEYKSRPSDVPLETPNDSKITDDTGTDSDFLVSFDGKDYVSANRASKITGYNQDYVGQLARSGKVLSRQVGNRWYVDREGILAHKNEKDALLAAVQSASVGIHRHPPELATEKTEEIPVYEEPIMNYSVEDKDLHPPIPLKAYGDDEHNIIETHPTTVETVPITIRTPQKRPPVERRQDVHGSMAHTGRKNEAHRVSFAPGITIFACMIFASCTFLGLSLRSTVASSIRRDQTALVGGAVTRIVSGPLFDFMGAFENFIAPPLTYTKK